MVVALDEPTAAWLEARNVAHYTKVLTSRTGSTDNHATSGLKFKVLVDLGAGRPNPNPNPNSNSNPNQVLVDFLKIGCSVLLSPQP